MVSLAIVAGTAVADLSTLHAQNPNWPAHARFHAIWHVVHVAGVQSVAIALLWVGTKRQSVDGLSPAVGVLAAYALSFLASAAAAPLFDASITPDVPAELMPPQPLGLDGNFLSVLVVTPVILIGWLLARRGAARDER